MGDFFGKKSKRRQTATMNQMNQMIQERLKDLQGRRGEAQEALDLQRTQFEGFEFTNPFEAAQNPFAGTQTDFRNIYADVENQFAGLENLYEGMENRFEDMTVDMRAADFKTQQMQPRQANIKQGIRCAAGTSGIAGLAQAMAQQGALQTQQIAAGISQQERQNQILAAQEGARIDQLQRGAGMQLQQLEATGAMQTQQMRLAGESQARQLGIAQQNLQAQGQWQADMARMEGEAAVQAAEFGRESTLLGMDYGLLAGANQAEQVAIANQMSAMGMQANMYGARAQNSMFSQLLNAGSQIASAYYMGQSDRRLKKNINKIGESPSGLNVYSFEYKNPIDGEGLFQGVMSDEIPQEAVIQMDNGYDAVNYSMLDVEFKQI